MEELAPDIFKGQKIIVTVDEANPDLLVVSFEHGSKCFQGVLLDSRKGRIPCGVYPPGGQFPPPLPPISENDDRLYAVKQRHTYCQNQESTAAPEDNKGKKGIQLRKSISLTPRFKNARMTVRLRPRQVLCSKCQSICNEKSENVSGAKGQKPSEPPVRGQTTYSEPRRDSRRETRQQHLQDSSRRGGGGEKCCPKLVPKLVKLRPSEIETATNKGVSGLALTPLRSSKSDSDSNDSEVSVGSNSAFVSSTSSPSKVPKLTISTNVCSADTDNGRGKGRIPKMTISTINLNLNPSEASKEVSGKSRSSRHSSGESLEDSRTPSIPKMILSTSGMLVDCHDKKDRMKKMLDSSDQSESKHRGDAKELKLRSGNVHKMTFTSSFVSSTANSDIDKDKSSAIPKLTILPLGQKKAEGLENKDVSVLDKVHSRKKRSLGSVEGLWDEEMLDDANKKRKQDSGLDGGAEKNQVIKEGEGEDEDLPRTTPVLKISFGREGRGMVMKIPAKSTSVSSHPTESETEEELEKKRKDISAKAAKKSLKKAKKEAQRKALNGGASPGYAVGGMSPRFGGMSPLRLGGVSCMSPARIGGFSPSRFGGASPARFGGMSPARAAVDITNKDLPPKKHKHKVKHKKKHKEDRKHKECEDNKEKKVKEAEEIKTELQEPPDSTSSTLVEVGSMSEDPGVWNVAETSQQQESASVTRQKLSISIKRLNKGYIACDPHQNDLPVDDTNKVSTTDETGLLLDRLQDSGEELERAESSHEEDSSNSDEYSGSEVPNFPASALVMNKEVVINDSETDVSEAAHKESQACVQAKGVGSSAKETLEHLQQEWQNVEMSLTEDGRSLAVGDVVWGKIHGFPWWPAKVVGLRVLLHPTDLNSGNEQWFQQQQAHVSWFGSSTSSMMQADALQPFLEMFKIRHNKKKRGPYREAVRQATAEARRNAGLEQEETEEKQDLEQQETQEQLQQGQQDLEDYHQQQLQQQQEQEQQHSVQQLQQQELQEQEQQEQEQQEQERHQQKLQEQELQQQELQQEDLRQEDLRQQDLRQQEQRQQDLQQQDLQQQELQQPDLQQQELQEPGLQQQELQQQELQLELTQQQEQHKQHQLEHHQREQEILQEQQQEQELSEVEDDELLQQLEEEQDQELRHYQELHVLSVPVGVYPKQTDQDQEVTQQQQGYEELSEAEDLEREENLMTDVRFGNGRLMPYYEPKDDYLGRGTVIRGEVIQQTPDHLQLQQDDMEQDPEPQPFESSGTTDDFQHTQELGFEAQGELPSVTPEHLVGASPREVDVVS